MLTIFDRFAEGEHRASSFAIRGVGDPRENGLMVGTTANEILRLRLLTQRISPIGTTDVAPTVRHLLALQAQDFAQALWAVGLRSDGATRADVLAALERGDVVRTLPMRGTLHFVASEDLRWMLALTAERSLQSAATRFRTLGLDQQTLDRAAGITRDALAGGGSLSRDEFMKLLAAAGIDPAGQRGYHVIFSLTQLALVCWGPPRGTQQALVLVDEWIAPTPELDRQDALEQLTLRYFASHGPATERDFAWWTKLTLKDVRAAIAGLGEQLTTLSVNGTEYLIATSALESDVSSESRMGRTTAVHILPGFDEYLIAYQDRSLGLAAEHFERIVPGSNGIFLPLIVERGKVVGTWRRDAKTKTPLPEHFADATSAQLNAFAQAAARYDQFTRG